MKYSFLNFYIKIQNISIKGSEKVNNLMLMIMSAFDIDTSSMDSFHLRFVSHETFSENDLMMHLANSLSANFSYLTQNLTDDKNFISTSFFAYPGTILHGDLTINEFLSVNDLRIGDMSFFLLCPERAPRNLCNEIAVKCQVDQKLAESMAKGYNAETVAEVIVDLNTCSVGELTLKLADKLSVKSLERDGDDESYYLQTTGWMGDAENALNNFDIACGKVPLKHNQMLLLTRGKLVPPNHIKVKAWISKVIAAREDESVQSLTKKLNESKLDDDEVILNELIEVKYREFKFLDELVVSNGLKLDELKVLIQSLLLDRSVVEECEHLRLRLLKKLSFDTSPRFQMKKSLFEWHKTLKQLHLSQEVDVFVQKLEEEENFNQGRHFCFFWLWVELLA